MTFAEGPAGDDFGLHFVVFAEEQAFADADFAAGTNQALPVVWLGRELAGEQDLDASVKEIASGGVAAADGLGSEAGAMPVETGGKNASVVKNYNVVRAQKIGKIAEMAVVKLSGCAVEVQHAGTIACGKRLLGDEFFGKMEVEIRNQHSLRVQEVQRNECRRDREFRLTYKFDWLF